MVPVATQLHHAHVPVQEPDIREARLRNIALPVHSHFEVILLHLLPPTILPFTLLHLPIPRQATQPLILIQHFFLLFLHEMSVANAALFGVGFNLRVLTWSELPDDLRVLPGQVALEQLLLELSVQILQSIGQAYYFYDVLDKFAGVEAADRVDADVDGEHDPELGLKEEQFGPA